jgi:mRNA-degrading endonuclease YafQ of YafQ-DinJ toxin-antitoxin module
MQFFFTKNFDKQYKKLPKKVRSQFAERLLLLSTDEKHPLLKLHELKGAKSPLMSMNVTADYRALYLKEKGSIYFQEIVTHSELY